MYKNIVFDLGGVMVEWKPRDFLMDRFMNDAIEKTVYNITFGSNEWKLLDRGSITRAVANERMLANAKKAGCVFEVQEVIDTWITILQKRRRLCNLALILQKNGYHVYYLSNIASDALEHLVEYQMLPSFDGGIASFEVNCNKPDPDIYQALLKKYQLNAEECVFIDDMKENVHAACELGFTGIVMKNSVNTLIRNLRSCGITLR